MPNDTAPREAIIVCDHVSLAYGRDEVVHDACLTIQRGSFLPFVGPNGAGKTTLLRAILGLLKPRRGRIVTPFNRCRPGYVPQQKSIDRLYPVSTRQIVAMGLYPQVGWWRRTSRAQKETVQRVLEQFNLADHAKKTFGELSGGMRQKAMIARALAGGAEVFIMDEPTSELDEQSEKDLLGHLFRLSREQGKTVLLAHHGLDHISELAPVVCMVKHGRVSLVKTSTPPGSEVNNMLEQFQTLFSLFPQALVAGIVIAAVCSLLGVFVILKRVVFIGIALSEVAACGIAAGMIFGVHPYIGAGVLTLAAVALLAQPFEMDRIPRDAILGIIFVLASGLSVLLVAKSGFGLQEVKSLLYGDLILTSDKDLTVILATLLPVLAWVLATVRPTLYTFLDREAAKLLGVKVNLWEMAFFFALGLAVSAASKVAGAMLVFCYLVVAPAAALVLSRRLWLVLLTAALLAVGSTVAGMCWSVWGDLPTNPTIAVTTCAGFIVVFACRMAQWWMSKIVLRNQTRREG